jgi:long-chain fatty acid transport protein
MRRIVTFFLMALTTGTLFAGGVVTNTNQSAAWVRLLARDASTEADAVYFNPAGVMKMANGFHFSISNQTIFENREVENFYKGPGDSYGLNQSLYKGTIFAPVFPSIYATYKMDKFGFSFGFNPIGGGGGAKYSKGLPSFELAVSDLVPALASQGATAYRLNTYFKGTSVFFGFQGAVSYKINDMISVAGGIRYVTAKNTYNGYLNNVEINLGTNDTPAWIRADAIMKGIAGNASTAAASTSALVGAGAGSLTLAQAEAATIITTQQRMQLEGALTAFGSPTNIPIAQADAVFKGAAAKYTLTGKLLRDQSADVTQTGSGFAPFLSVNISPLENLNIGIKYEFATKLELKNKTVKDFTTAYTSLTDSVTMFPNGEKIRSDLPAMLSVGVAYGITPKLNLSVGVHYYWDKNANYGHQVDGVYVSNKEIFTKNYYELAAGLEYKINKMFLVSGGYLYSKTGVNKDYQSDLTNSLTSSSVGIGGAIDILENLRINLGFLYAFYDKGGKTINHFFSPTGDTIPAQETYKKDNKVIAIGVDFSF